MPATKLPSVRCEAKPTMIPITAPEASSAPATARTCGNTSSAERTATTTITAITAAAMIARPQKDIDPLFDAGHSDSSDGPAAGEAVVVSVPEPDLVLPQ